MLNGFNSRQLDLHRITGRSYREEANTPSHDLLTAARTRRHQRLGHILRMPADRLVRHAVLALGQRAGPPYKAGSLLMDTPFPLDELVLRAADRRGWARDTRSLSSHRKAPKGYNSKDDDDDGRGSPVCTSKTTDECDSRCNISCHFFKVLLEVQHRV